MITEAIFPNSRIKRLENIKLLLSYSVRLSLEKQLYYLKNKVPLALGMPSYSELNKTNVDKFKECVRLSIINFDQTFSENIEVIVKNDGEKAVVNIILNKDLIELELHGFDARILV